MSKEELVSMVMDLMKKCEGGECEGGKCSGSKGGSCKS